MLTTRALHSSLASLTVSAQHSQWLCLCVRRCVLYTSGRWSWVVLKKWNIYTQTFGVDIILTPPRRRLRAFMLPIATFQLLLKSFVPKTQTVQKLYRIDFSLRCLFYPAAFKGSGVAAVAPAAAAAAARFSSEKYTARFSKLYRISDFIELSYLRCALRPPYLTLPTYWCALVSLLFFFTTLLCVANLISARIPNNVLPCCRHGQQNS